MDSKASVVWNGGLKDGKGYISTTSDALRNVQYSYASRFEGDSGTNPEELIAAAHAACYSMALSLGLGKAGMTADAIETRATVTLKQDGGGFSITDIHLDVTARIPNADKASFDQIAAETKEACPVSKVLKANISLAARLDVRASLDAAEDA